MFFAIGNDKKSRCGRSCKKLLRENCIQYSKGAAAVYGYDFRYLKTGELLDYSITKCLRDMGIPFSDNALGIVIPEDNFMRDVLDKTPLNSWEKAKRPSAPASSTTTSASPPAKPRTVETTRLIKTPPKTEMPVAAKPAPAEPIRASPKVSVEKPAATPAVPRNTNSKIELYRVYLMRYVKKQRVPGFPLQQYVFNSRGHLNDPLLTFDTCALLRCARQLELPAIFIPGASLNDFTLLFCPDEYEKKVIDHTYDGGDLEEADSEFTLLYGNPLDHRDLADISPISSTAGEGPVFQKCTECGHETLGDVTKECDICGGTEFTLIKPGGDTLPTFVETIIGLMSSSKYKNRDFHQIEGASSVLLQDGSAGYILNFLTPESYNISLDSGLSYSIQMLFTDWQRMTVKQLEKDLRLVHNANRRFQAFEDKRVADDRVGKLEKDKGAALFE